MNNLKFKNTKDLRFTHTEEGVIAIYKKKKFILGYSSISNKNVDFTDQEYISMAESVLKYHCSVRNVPLHTVESLIPVTSTKLSNDYSPFYKYVSNDVFEKYIKNGVFQLGTIEQYRTIENIKQRDEFEGHSFLNLNINNHIVSTICNSGFNYLIFCGTKSASSTGHKKQFGEKELYFPNVRAFADIISKKINAKRYYIQNVEYNTLKLYINKNKIYAPKIGLNGEHFLVPEYFDIIEKKLVYPSLFVKPDSFKDENEVRIVFEMYRDANQPYRFECEELLKHIKY